MRKFVCSICGYIYEEANGIPDAGIAPGTKWEDLPDGWVCPWCKAAKAMFNEVVEEKQEEAPVVEAAVSQEAVMDAMEKSIICSNFALSCEKQRMLDQAEKFQKLAAFFRAKAGKVAKVDIQRLLALSKKDIDELYPAAEKEGWIKPDRGALRAITWTGKASLKMDVLLKQYAKQGEAITANTNVYVCSVCGYIHIGDEPPARCPVCNVPALKFVKAEGRNA